MVILVGNDTLFASANISFLAPGKEYFLAVCKFLRTKREYCKVFGRGKLGYTICAMMLSLTKSKLQDNPLFSTVSRNNFTYLSLSWSSGKYCKNGFMTTVFTN
jgi:hypothetical protein